MRNPSQRIAPFLFASLVVPLSAAPSRTAAAQAAPPVGPAQNPTALPMSTVCGWQASATSCAVGQFLQCPTYCATSACSVAHPAGECTKILQPVWSASYAAASSQLAATSQPTTKRTIVPATMAQRDGMAAGTVFSVLPIASNTLTPFSTGTGAGFQDTNWGLSFVQAVNYPRYSQYDEGIYANLTMNDCDEYAWKKWGDYSWFNDLGHTSGTHYEWLIDVVGAGTLGVVTGVLSNGQRWDGRDIALNGTSIAYPQSIPRNPFFALSPGWMSTTDPTQVAITQAIMQYWPLPTQTIYFPQGTRLDEFWAASEKQYLEEAGLTPSTFADNERRMAAYQQLVQQYQADEWALDNANCRTPYMCRKLLPPLEAAVAQDEKALTAALLAEWGYDSHHGCLGYTFPVPGEKSIGPQFASASGPAGYTFLANGCDWTPHMFAQEFVDQLEPQVEAARNRCIADTGNDWTQLENPASVFPDNLRMHVPYNHALTRGTNDATTDEADLTWAPNPIPGAHTQTWDQYQNSTSVEQYLWNYENRDWINQQTEAEDQQAAATLLSQTTSLPLQGSLPGTTPGQATTVGQRKTDGNSVGGSWFGGGYLYDAGWSIVPRVENPSDPNLSPPAGTYDTVPHICSLAGEADARLNAYATVFSQNITLLDAWLQVNVDPPPLAPAGTLVNREQTGTVTLTKAHLTILDNVFNNGQDYLAGPLGKVGLKEGSSWSGSSFDLPITATPGTSFSTIIPVCGIPIEIAAGIQAKLGADFQAQASPPPYCDRNNPGLSMSTSITPSAEIDAFVTIAVDLGIASAGVEGDLTLFRASMPITGSVHLSSAATSDPNQISLVVDTAGNLTMNELSGDLDLYAELLGAKADVTLFSWGGFNQNLPLWSTTNSWPLIAMNYRLDPTQGNVETLP